MTNHPTIDHLSMVADHEADVPEGIAAHVSGCSDCMARVHALRELSASARALSRDLQPPASAWLEVRNEIERRKVVPADRTVPAYASRRVLIPMAAAAAILVIVTAVTTAHFVRRPPAASSRSIADQSTMTPAALVSIDRSYQPTLEQLTAALNESRDKLEPATVARVEHNLRIIDDAIAEVRDALVHDPNNAALVQILAANYRQKIDLLRRLSEWVPTS